MSASLGCLRLMLLAEACEHHAMLQQKVAHNGNKIILDHSNVQSGPTCPHRTKRKDPHGVKQRKTSRERVSPTSFICEFENIGKCRSDCSGKSLKESESPSKSNSMVCINQSSTSGCYNLRSTKKQKLVGLPNDISSTQKKFLLWKEDFEPTRELFRLVENHNWEAVIKRTKSHPQDTKWRDSSGWFVLHRVICDQASFEVIHAVWQAFPAAIHSIGRDGKTPLHCAFRWGCDSQLFEFMLDRSVIPTLSTLEAAIDLPVDILNTCIVPFLGRSPLLVQDEHGWSVLHWMVFKNTKAELVQKIVNAAPQALTLTNAQGSTPLHFACRYDKPLDVLLVLIRTLPDTLTMVDKEGRVPLQIASFYSSNYKELMDNLPSP